MEVKLIEIRDEGTFIPVIAIKPVGETEEERYLVARTGYGLTADDQRGYVILLTLARFDLAPMPDDPSVRLVHCAAETPRPRERIMLRFAAGDVVDVEHILGETPKPKLPERVEMSTRGAREYLA